MILISNGCSYTYGHELPEKTRVRDAYGGVLSRELNMKHVNLGIPGGSNDHIVRTTLTWAIKNKHLYKNLFFVIGWSAKSRREWYSSLYKNYWQFVKESPPSIYQIDVRNKVIEFHKKYLCDDYSDDKNTVLNILSLQNFFENNNISYLMCDALEYEDADIKNKNLYKEINYTNYKTNICFYSYVQHNKFPVAKMGHPLKEAHEAWANELLNFMRENDISF